MHAHVNWMPEMYTNRSLTVDKTFSFSILTVVAGKISISTWIVVQNSLGLFFPFIIVWQIKTKVHIELSFISIITQFGRWLGFISNMRILVLALGILFMITALTAVPIPSHSRKKVNEYLNFEFIRRTTNEWLNFCLFFWIIVQRDIFADTRVIAKTKCPNGMMSGLFLYSSIDIYIF